MLFNMIFFPDPNPELYCNVLRDLSEAWIDAETHHKVSKQASDDFFDIASKWFHKLYQAKARDLIQKNVPKFTTLRRRLHKTNVPPIELEIAYKNRETGEITVVKAEKTPVKQFNPREYEKIYEAAKVKVIIMISCSNQGLF